MTVASRGDPEELFKSYEGEDHMLLVVPRGECQAWLGRMVVGYSVGVKQWVSGIVSLSTYLGIVVRIDDIYVAFQWSEVLEII